jgi:hypothetical protein
MKLLHPLFLFLSSCALAFVEFAKWVAVIGCVGMLALGFTYFGYKLERAASHYAHGQRMETLQALYGSTDWASIVRNEKALRLKVEKRLEDVCKRAKRACL